MVRSLSGAVPLTQVRSLPIGRPTRLKLSLGTSPCILAYAMPAGAHEQAGNLKTRGSEDQAVEEATDPWANGASGRPSGKYNWDAAIVQQFVGYFSNIF